jgi:glycosyltransferase involved in cell wall biosynthesis
MRILHVIASIDPREGGPTSALVGLACAQQRAGIDVRAISTFRQGESRQAAEQMEAAGVNVQLIGPASGPLVRHPQIQSRLEQEIAQADIVHIHALWEEIQHRAARLAQRRGLPYIIRPCGMLDPWSLSQGKWKKKIYLALRLRRNLNRAAALHFTAELERDLTAPLRLQPPAIIEPNGIRLEEFQNLPPRGVFRGRYPQLAGDRRMLLFLSRVHHKKGLDLLVPALARLRHGDAMLVIVGPDRDGYGRDVAQMAAQNKVSDRVIFAGPLYGADRVSALVDADLFVLPSYQENFGIVVIEALAAGRPVVISDQVNIHREITAAALGGVVPTRIEPLAAELDRWLSDEVLRQAAAGRAREFVWQHYDWDQIARRWLGHYQRLITTSRGSRR